MLIGLGRLMQNATPFNATTTVFCNTCHDLFKPICSQGVPKLPLARRPVSCYVLCQDQSQHCAQKVSIVSYCLKAGPASTSAPSSLDIFNPTTWFPPANPGNPVPAFSMQQAFRSPFSPPGGKFSMQTAETAQTPQEKGVAK